MNRRRMDYHIHTRHSEDGKQTVEEAARYAEAIGLDEICLTEHIDLGHPCPSVNRAPDARALTADIETARISHPSLRIRTGVEIGDNEPTRAETTAYLQTLSPDFYLLSLHLVDGADPYSPDYFTGRTQGEAYRAYAARKLESVLTFPDYDAVAHLGYVAKFAPYPADIRPFRLSHAPDELDALLSFMAREGKALEINASGIQRMGSPIPGFDIISRFIALGGEFFTFGSDAHQTARVYADVEQAKEIALSAGAKWQAGFSARVLRVYRL